MNTRTLNSSQSQMTGEMNIKSFFIVNLISINALFASFTTAMLYSKATSNGSSEKRVNTLPTWKWQQGLDSLPPLSSPLPPPKKN